MIGCDMGTYNLVACRRDAKGNFVTKREVNAFLEMPLENRYVFNMMKAAGVPLIEHKDAKIAYALGEAAVEIAYTMSEIELKRPMKDGCLNPKEKHAQQILSIMVHSLIGDIKADETVCYSVPANAINQETDADYHSKVLEAIFKAYESESGFKLNPLPVNEALALVYAELQSKMFTGIAISCGAGMMNICFALRGSPIFEFAIVNSGDWIDKMAAKATGESIAFINQEKTKTDLTIPTPDTLVQRAIKAQYEILIQKSVQAIKKGLEGAANKARTGKPIDIVVAGGTSLPNGFDTMFGEVARSANLPIEVGEIIRPKDPLYSVARGCLLVAEMNA